MSKERHRWARQKIWLAIIILISTIYHKALIGTYKSSSNPPIFPCPHSAPQLAVGLCLFRWVRSFLLREMNTWNSCMHCVAVVFVIIYHWMQQLKKALPESLPGSKYIFCLHNMATPGSQNGLMAILTFTLVRPQVCPLVKLSIPWILIPPSHRSTHGRWKQTSFK